MSEVIVSMKVYRGFPGAKKGDTCAPSGRWLLKVAGPEISTATANTAGRVSCMDDIKVVLTWRAQARRGDVRRMADFLGVSDQLITNAVAEARRGTYSVRVAKLAEAIRSLEQRPTRDLGEVVQPSTTPTAIDDLVQDVVLASGHPAPEVLEYVRKRFPAVRNFFDRREYVFAAVVSAGEKGGAT